MSRVLVLSAHETQLDRRIVAEVNTLAESGREVTLVSVPTEIPTACLDPRVSVIAPPVAHPVAGQRAGLKALLRRVWPPLYDVVRSAWYGLGRGPVPALSDFFVRTVPAGPFDVIHGHDLPTLPAAIALRQRWGRATVIYDSHELFADQFEDRRVASYWSGIEARHINEADGVITVNDSIARELSERYGIRRPEVIYNSYGLAGQRGAITESAFCAHFGTQPGGFKVLFQGCLDVGRNLENLVLAFGALQDQARLFLLGGGPLEPTLKRLRDRHGLSNVFFGPRVPQKDLIDFTVHADLGVIPYLGAGNLNMRYCTPNKLFEYIEAQVPICASDLPELGKIVRNSGIGGVFPMETPEQIAAALADCRRRRATGEFFAPEAWQAAREQYSWTRQAQRLLSFYERLGV